MKTIVITGASGGIGAATAKLLASKGHAIVLIARREKELADTARECGPNSCPIVADMTRRDDAECAVADAISKFGQIDVWMNNVGRGISRPASELTDDDIDLVMQVNVKSALYGMQAVLPHFKERGDGQIINISSMLGRIPFAIPRSAYNGAKHFLNAITANLRMELADSYPGIVISLVSPGVVRTDFGLNAIHGGIDSRDLPFSQSADEVAEVIADVIERKRLDVYTRGGSRQRVIDYFTTLGEDP
jgi:NADP-dependent 3-hydroxy acid dehydrogenase YdfG